MKRIFITGISTDVGKTIAAAIVTESLNADYWKPVQAGDLTNTDSHKLAELISNKKTRIHKSSYELNTPMSPHAAAEIDNLTIDINKIKEPLKWQVKVGKTDSGYGILSLKGRNYGVGVTYTSLHPTNIGANTFFKFRLINLQSTGKI